MSELKAGDKVWVKGQIKNTKFGATETEVEICEQRVYVRIFDCRPVDPPTKEPTKAQKLAEQALKGIWAANDSVNGTPVVEANTKTANDQLRQSLMDYPFGEPANCPEIPDSSSDPIQVGDAVVIVERSHKWRGVRGRIVSVSESNEFPLEFISDCRERLGYFRSSSIRKIDKPDPINPSHYKHLPAEAIDIIMAAIAKAPSNQSAFLQGQIIKYLLRCWQKKGIEDLRKAKWYLDRLVGGFDDLLAEASGANDGPAVKQYREPTLADLANGPIFCESRDDGSQDWKSMILTDVAEGPGYPFLCLSAGAKNALRYAQCRIEVGE